MTGILLLGSAPPTANVLVKPTGSPTLNVSNSLTANMLLYSVDTGNNVYKICYDGTAQAPHFIDPPGMWGNTLNLDNGTNSPYYDADPSLFSTSDHGWGNAINWPGSHVDNMGQLIFVIQSSHDDLRAAVSLSGDPYGGFTSPPNGTGFTMGVTFVQLGNNDTGGGTLWGRMCNLDIGPDGIGNIDIDSTGHLRFSWLTVHSTSPNTAGPQSIVSANVVTQNVLHTAVATMIKNSSGNVDVALYLDGALVNSASNSASWDQGGPYGGDNEDQLQMGSTFHVAGRQPDRFFNGQIMQGWIATRQWSQAEANTIFNNPYSMLTGW